MSAAKPHSVADSLGIVRTVLTNKLLYRYDIIPETSVTPDQICQHGLIRFESQDPESINPVGYLRISYIWILALCTTYPSNWFLS